MARKSAKAQRTRLVRSHKAANQAAAGLSKVAKAVGKSSKREQELQMLRGAKKLVQRLEYLGNNKYGHKPLVGISFIGSEGVNALSYAVREGKPLGEMGEMRMRALSQAVRDFGATSDLKARLIDEYIGSQFGRGEMWADLQKVADETRAVLGQMDYDSLVKYLTDTRYGAARMDKPLASYGRAYIKRLMERNGDTMPGEFLLKAAQDFMTQSGQYSDPGDIEAVLSRASRTAERAARRRFKARSRAAQKGWETRLSRMTPEVRAAMESKRAAAARYRRTAEFRRRSKAAKKGWETRRKSRK